MKKANCIFVLCVGILLGCQANAESHFLGSRRESAFIPQGDNHFEIRIFPNPFKDYVSIEIKSPHAAPTFIKLFDIIGVEVLSIDLSEYNAQNGIYTITLKDLPHGVYFCNVYSDKKLLESKKIIASK